MSLLPCFICGGTTVSPTSLMCSVCTGPMRRTPLVPRPADPLPPDLTPLERDTLEQIRKADDMDPTTPPVSPTGAPVVSGSGLFTKIAIAVVALAAAASQADFFPATNLDEQIAGFVISVGAILGIASPGLRRK